mmetsp:Transcript_1543/g.4008  ORF Transcript_1543/g.4008 Transcript_1543/m.4008 type:complete len:81 (-) Transcript_1543:501-743(-)
MTCSLLDMFKIQPHYLLSELLAWHTAFRCVLDSLSDDLLPRKAMIVASTLPGSSTLARASYDFFSLCRWLHQLKPCAFPC